MIFVTDYSHSAIFRRLFVLDGQHMFRHFVHACFPAFVLDRVAAGCAWDQGLSMLLRIRQAMYSCALVPSSAHIQNAHFGNIG